MPRIKKYTPLPVDVSLPRAGLNMTLPRTKKAKGGSCPRIRCIIPPNQPPQQIETSSTAGEVLEKRKKGSREVGARTNAALLSTRIMAARQAHRTPENKDEFPAKHALENSEREEEIRRTSSAISSSHSSGSCAASMRTASARGTSGEVDGAQRGHSTRKRWVVVSCREWTRMGDRGVRAPPGRLHHQQQSHRREEQLCWPGLAGVRIRAVVVATRANAVDIARTPTNQTETTSKQRRNAPRLQTGTCSTTSQQCSRSSGRHTREEGGGGGGGGGGAQARRRVEGRRDGRSRQRKAPLPSGMNANGDEDMRRTKRGAAL
ncbi:hypothetical protein C8J57DRAFT_1628757 [Mycena rebaudengoi]|nr:hypothetical protein C8J57DRAFT_1628757 [Mycena rebaudengoi]